MTTPDPMKVADWLAILQLPEVGERVCRAAGIVLDYDSRDHDGNPIPAIWPVETLERFGHRGPDWDQEMLPAWMDAALAFGGLAVLAEFDYPQVCEDGGRWRVVFDFTDSQPEWCDTLSEAVLAALRQMYAEN